MLPGCSIAQSSTDGELEALKRITKEARESVNQTNVDPSLGSLLRTPNLQALLSATRDDTKVKAEIGIKPAICGRKKLQASVTLAGPIGKNDSEATLATLEGLTDQATASIGLRVTWPDPDTVILGGMGSGDGIPGVTKILMEIWQEENPGKDLQDGYVDSSMLTVKGQRDFLQKLGLGGGIKMFSIEATYGARKTFKYLASNSLEEMQETRDGFSFGVAGGWLPLKKGYYFFGLTYRYEESYKAQPEQEICTPFGDAGALQCRKIAVGAPEKTEKQLGQFELRKYFLKGDLAINPKFTRDFENDVTGIELPVYFLKDALGALNGGIAIGWRSDTRDYTVSAFVGSLKKIFQ